MSIKIYDGLIIERDMTLMDARALTVKVRPKVDQIIETAQTRWAARAAVRAHDRALMGRRRAEDEGSEGEQLSTWRNALSAGGHAIDQERDKDKNGERSILALSLEAALMPVGLGKTLALSYGSKELKEEFAKIAKAKPYEYWNNSERPDDVEPRAWAQRRRDWQKALGKTMQWTPAEAGAGLILSSSKYKTWWTPAREAIALAVAENPELGVESRARRIAREELMSTMLAAREVEFKHEQSMAPFVRVQREISNVLKSEDGLEQVEALARRLSPFVPELSLDRLQMPLGKVQEQGALLRQALKEHQALDQVAAPCAAAFKPRL